MPFSTVEHRLMVETFINKNGRKACQISLVLFTKLRFDSRFEGKLDEIAEEDAVEQCAVAAFRIAQRTVVVRFVFDDEFCGLFSDSEIVVVACQAEQLMACSQERALVVSPS